MKELSALAIPILAFAISTYIPGIQRKIEARIQQRIGPSILSPGFWAFFKFIFKETQTPDAKLYKLYNNLPLLSIAVLSAILIVISLNNFLANLIFIVGLLKIEEMMYIILGSLSNSIMGCNMPFEDDCKGAKFINVIKYSLEQLSAIRNFKLITIGSFPFYLSLFLPFVNSKSIFINDLSGVFLFSLSGVFGAVCYFIGYLIMIKEYPFSISHTKADVIEGATLELMGKYRAFYLALTELLMITLGILFAVLYLNIIPNIEQPITILESFAIAIIFPILAAVVRAFSPLLLFKHIYPISYMATLIGVVGFILALLGW
ncbi:NADH ubiquinone oxidoreductase, subunit 1 isolog [Methanocaldococcus villosus KIN24-T80]|uniref:NADH ubiquinone oxidoreductase, subunit 1 isolog n=1 Tax=Methanocaldococcus villosus KIN24-T80 TaxID=1069083 RepID=N6UWB1_9EURY|nr:NADH-quinone oxidoreductase subunit H [Methanocaldococcus villosus]ENN96589.1 NADH ubiquinone oxidoreductase, subunit 1 isolog [Methanocaldococcus villosus KIN24-T80]